MFAGKVDNLRHFGFRHFVSKDSTFADTALMHMHHDSMRCLVILVEDTFEDIDHEIHRGVVIVEKQNTIEVRPLRLPPCLGDDRRPGRAIALAIIACQTGDTGRITLIGNTCGSNLIDEPPARITAGGHVPWHLEEQ